MSEIVLEILQYGSEGYLIDFKQQQYPLGKYPKKHEFLKDISAMANHPKDEDKYIIIGAVEKDGVADSFINISELTDQAQYQQYLDTYIEPQINFEYRLINYSGFQLAYFRICDNTDRPYLFKKEVKNGKETNKNEFREGDGFIRTGTSTRKLVRSDFDLIYKNKLQKDRKQDLKIIPQLNDFCDFTSDEIAVKTLDLNIENSSNKSIDFDIEMRVFKNDSCGFISYSKFQEEIRKGQRSRMLVGSPILPNFRVEVQEDDNCFVITRTMLQRSNTTMSIAQNETLTAIFEKEFLVTNENTCNIKVEVIIRSDDFTEGALIKEFDIESTSKSCL